ncbi:hypothetical protein NEICINOT_05050 [Neisseria cinerea ATCC 14685]|uniref:Uncharacterized protein n=1 Tax=Neisseria cinerea ATCC 14685 TaxID=546262 RepID=D0W5T1_NEICI|nr:hypothetical protein NEICINOT_05050 [Neisseria cinerea ATCC 14685]
MKGKCRLKTICFQTAFFTMCCLGFDGWLINPLPYCLQVNCFTF